LFAFFYVSLLASRNFYSEFVFKSSKNDPSSKAGIFSPEAEASLARLVDDKVISVEDKASTDEAGAKSDK